MIEQIQDDFIKLISQISSLGTPVIAYFSWRAYTTVFQTKASEAQFNRVVDLIKELRKIEINTTDNDIPKLGSIYYLYNNYYKTSNTSNDVLRNIQIKSLVTKNKNVLYNYYYDPIVPKDIRKELKGITKIKMYGELEKVDQEKIVYILLKTVIAIDKWFEEKGLEEYTLDDTDA